MNLLARDVAPSRALLALEDSTTYPGYAAGAPGEAFGEIVFNTSMTGYQEIVSDPSYAAQIVTLTYPQVGNYGICPDDFESAGLHLRGLVVRDMCHTPSSWRATQSLPELLRERGVVAIEGVDTRALTLAIRSRGTMRAAISTVDLDPQSLVARVRRAPHISDANHVADVSCTKPYVVRPRGARRLSVVALDCGVKRSILDGLVRCGCAVTVVPWDTSADQVRRQAPDGVLVSNGPGDPTQVRATAATCAQLLGTVPILGICLGSQLLTLAAGGRIEKLPFGHHGGNEPVCDLRTGRVEITSQNHNFATVFESLGPLVAELSGGHADHERDLAVWARRRVAPVVDNPLFGRIRLTHVNLNDGTAEGLEFLDAHALSCQYHPEASPGPHDAAYHFDAFARLMEACVPRQLNKEG